MKQTIYKTAIVILWDCRWNRQLIKKHVDETAHWWNRYLMQHCVDESASWWNKQFMKQSVGIIAWLMKLFIGENSCYWNRYLTKHCVDESSFCWDSQASKKHSTKFSKFKILIKFLLKTFFSTLYAASLGSVQ
jgi:hypothetical protein